ncbi:hypothetical protein ABKT77_23320 [Enterobacter cloacae]|uniref:hypothetical protein n=1 Tax=Enterobacter cloacae TaxID=550 RepID=UPI0032AFE91E
MTIKNLTEESRFTKEQLIEHVTRQLDMFHRQIKSQPLADNNYNRKTITALEIALAALTAPDYIPPHVLDAMSNMCDGGFNAQGIWDLCRESILPPEPCPRCGTVSSRPDGAHYCHAADA